MDLPDGYEFRAPTEDDIDAIAEILAVDDPDETGEATLDADFVREEWSRTGFDPATDAWVAVDAAETVVAYANVAQEDEGVLESWGVVHPDRRGRGIGSALLDRIEERAPKLVAEPSTARLRHAINAGDADAAGMLRARAFRPVRHFWHMQIDLDTPGVEAQPAPDGIEISPVDSDDDFPAVHAILSAAFADDWGYHPQLFEKWLDEYRSSPSLDPTLWLVARDDGTPVAALTASIFGDRGWVGELGVLLSHRGRGVARAMLRRSFAAFSDRGLKRVNLNVDAANPTGATALYERVGMRVVKRWDLWERSLDVAGRETDATT